MSDDQVLEVTRRLSAPAAEVFRWWTEPELLRQWMSPVGTVEAEVDLRVGGAFRIVMRGDGVEIDHVGEYIEVEPPRRLVFTWSSRFTGSKPSVVTVELEPDGEDATQLRLVHSRLPASAVESHGSGWGAMLERLTRTLAAGSTGVDQSVPVENSHGG
ncbi:MAG TPA: SRPBCC domain-containing protein [Candidatus Dormibacteraeota bacterium]|jgi:uncharacterized protein YndB with AHSA1/START domain|nr:SRPBCC domain-containing protein [Candidatus Dormibacteraeota bacterium]